VSYRISATGQKLVKVFLKITVPISKNYVGHQSVVIGDAVSRLKLLLSGIPQGSNLRHKLFSLYLKSVGDIFKRWWLLLSCINIVLKFHIVQRISRIIWT